MEDRHNAYDNSLNFGVILKRTLAILFSLSIIGAVYIYSQIPREAVHYASCHANIKEMGTALAIYCDDYHGAMPSSAVYGGKTWDAGMYEHFATLHGVTPPPDNAKNPTLAMLLYPTTKNKDIIWCPSLFHKPRNFLGIPLRDAELSPPTGPDARISYYYKASIDRAWFGGHDAKGKWSCRLDSDYKSPNNQVVFYENTGRHWNDDGKGLSNGVTINVVFMDGHADARIIVDAGNPKGNSDPLAPGEPAWFNSNFIHNNLGTGYFFDPRSECDDLPKPVDR